MPVGHQQRQGEAVQQPLGGAFPVALVLSHLDQLACKGQVVRIEPERTAHALADRQHARGDVGAAALE